MAVSNDRDENDHPSAHRWHGTFGAVNFADYLLTLFASPAIDYAQMLVVPVRYLPSDATKGESFVIAGLGFFLSTACWTAFGGLVSGGIRKMRERFRRNPKSDDMARVVDVQGGIEAAGLRAGGHGQENAPGAEEPEGRPVALGMADDPSAIADAVRVTARLGQLRPAER